MTSFLPAPAVYIAVGAGIFTANRARGTKIPERVLLAYVALPLLLFAPTFFAGKTVIPTDHIIMTPWLHQPSHREPFFNPSLNDILTQLAPWQLEVRRAWRSGALPWRFPWSGSGTALAANSQSAAFSPLTILSALVPFRATFELQAAWKILAMLLGSYLFLRELKFSADASVFGSVVIGLGMSTTVWMFFPAGSVAAMLPLSLYLAGRAVSSGATWRVLTILALTTFLAALSGHPETLAVTVSLLLAGTIWWPARSPGGSHRAKLLVVWAIVAGIGLAGFVLKPELDTIVASVRRASIVAASHPEDRPWLPHAPRVPMVFASLLMPTVLGDGISSRPTTDRIAFFDGALGYSGAVAIGAAIAGLILGRGRRRTGPFVVLLVCAAIASQSWPVLVLTKIVPLLNLINPARLLLGASLGIGILAALGVDELARHPRAARAHGLAAAACAATGIAIFFLARSFRSRQGIAPLAAGVGKVGWLEIVACLAAAGCLLLAGSRTWPPRRMVALLTLLASGELLAQGARLYRFHDPADLYPATPLTTFLEARTDPWRVIGVGSTLYPNSGAFTKLRDVRGHDPMEREDYSRLLCVATGADPRAYYQMVRNVDNGYLDFLAVRYAAADPGTRDLGKKWIAIYSEADGTVFENKSAAPIVTSPDRVREISDSRAAGGPLGRFGLSAEEIVGAVGRGETLLLSSAPWRASTGTALVPAEISDIRERAGETSFFAANASSEKYGLAIASLVQDGGWRAEDERGHALPTTLANGPFLAIAVPPGSHRIHLGYRPPGLRTGLGISGLSLAAVGLLLQISARPVPV